MEKFTKMKNEIEHTLNINSTGYLLIYPENLYDGSLMQYADIVSNSHIYFICKIPNLSYNLEDKKDNSDNKLSCYVNDDLVMERQVCSSQEMTSALATFTRLYAPLEVIYIGQSFGTDGKRNAYDRLLNHETLQKILVLEKSNDYQICILLVNIKKEPQLFMMMNPHAKDTSDNSFEKRIDQGFAKHEDTTLAELVSLYEAGFIRYFYPKYNKKFKDSFPSTNPKALTDCLEKDIAGLSVEFYHNDFNHFLFSEKIPPKPMHFAQYNLGNSDERTIFFSSAN